jgi:hypothetical protein
VLIKLLISSTSYVSYALGPKVEEEEGGKIGGKVMSVGLMRASDMTQIY